MINGNSGNDKLVGGFGTDTLDGGSSKDDCDDDVNDVQTFLCELILDEEY